MLGLLHTKVSTENDII